MCEANSSGRGGQQQDEQVGDTMGGGTEFEDLSPAASSPRPLPAGSPLPPPPPPPPADRLLAALSWRCRNTVVVDINKPYHPVPSSRGCSRLLREVGWGWSGGNPRRGSLPFFSLGASQRMPARGNTNTQHRGD